MHGCSQLLIRAAGNKITRGDVAGDSLHTKGRKNSEQMCFNTVLLMESCYKCSVGRAVTHFGVMLGSSHIYA